MSVKTDMQNTLQEGEQVIQTFEGSSTGLHGRSNRSPARAHMFVLAGAVIVGVEKNGLLAKRSIERFNLADLMAVEEDEIPLGGLIGAITRKNESVALGRAMGASSAVPGIRLQTRRGDLEFCFTTKQRGLRREAFVMISDLIGR